MGWYVWGVLILQLIFLLLMVYVFYKLFTYERDTEFFSGPSSERQRLNNFTLLVK